MTAGEPVTVEIPPELTESIQLELDDDGTVEQWVLDSALLRLCEIYREVYQGEVPAEVEVPDEIVKRARLYADLTDQPLDVVLMNRFLTFDFEFESNGSEDT
jgi:hypothetical protein